MDRDAEFLQMPFGFWVACAILGLLFGVVIMGFIEFGAKRSIPMPFADVYGCYSAPGGPDIMVQEGSLTILQDQRIVTASKLKFIKGWLFELESWLDVRMINATQFEVESIKSNGEFLSLSREDQTSPAVAEFALFSRRDMTKFTYRRSGSTCPSLQQR